MFRCQYCTPLNIICTQVLLRQEHHDQSARQTVRVQVRLSRTYDCVPPEPAAYAVSAVHLSSGTGPVISRHAARAVIVRLCRRPVWPTSRFHFQPTDRHISDRAFLLGHIRRGPFHAVPTSGRAAVPTVIRINHNISNLEAAVYPRAAVFPNPISMQTNWGPNMYLKRYYFEQNMLDLFTLNYYNIKSKQCHTTILFGTLSWDNK